MDIGGLEDIKTVPYSAEDLVVAEGAVADAERWLLRARPGACVLYHTGLLGRDRTWDPTANLLGALFGWAETVGLVLLVQKRLTAPEPTDEGEIPGTFEYLAYRTRCPWGLPLPLFDSKGRLHHNGNVGFMGGEG